jgi:hypothetical protein
VQTSTGAQDTQQQRLVIYGMRNLPDHPFLFHHYSCEVHATESTRFYSSNNIDK